MNALASGFESELRISPRWVLGGLVIIALAIESLDDGMLEPRRAQLQLFVVLVCSLAAVAWWLAGRRPQVAGWFTCVLLVGVIHWTYVWQGVPEALPLMAIPAGLGAALINLPAAAIIALAETVLLALLAVGAPGAGPAATGASLVAIWATVGVMVAVYRPVSRVARWAWDYYVRAHDLLEEARDHKVELEQTLDDLAQANLQLTRLNTLAQGLRQSAEDARAAKGQFVANVSHELRTPLNMIIGFSEMILQSPETYGDKIPPALLADLGVIHRNSQHLSTLIDDVLDLSQIDAGRMPLTKEHVRFQEIVQAATIVVRPLFESKGLVLTADVQGDLPPVFCDRTRMQEVLLNLLSNAGRFTERGGVHLCVRQEAEDVLVSVADTGLGIAVEDLDKLFQPFQQVDGSIRRRFGGTGLGLSISQRFIALHEGRIWVESEQGVGTTFFFRIRIAPSMPLSGGFLRGLTPGWEYLQRTRASKAPQATVCPRYVVLETGNELQRLLTRYMDGVEVAPVTGLDEALQELSREPAQALLVNGTSVSKDLERLSLAAMLPSGTPAIVCSVPGAQEASADLGVVDRLVKPISRQALLGALDRLKVEAGTVLIVDDEPDALQLFGRMLASSGREYQVLLARDGEEAVDVLREYHPDVMLLDLIMPNMDGFELLEMRSQDPLLSEIPVVVVSARDPAGQLIVSSAMAVTQGGGLSAGQLLAGIEVMSQILSPAGPVGGPAPTEVQTG